MAGCPLTCGVRGREGGGGGEIKTREGRRREERDWGLGKRKSGQGRAEAGAARGWGTAGTGGGGAGGRGWGGEGPGPTLPPAPPEFRRGAGSCVSRPMSACLRRGERQLLFLVYGGSPGNSRGVLARAGKRKSAPKPRQRGRRKIIFACVFSDQPTASFSFLPLPPHRGSVADGS